MINMKFIVLVISQWSVRVVLMCYEGLEMKQEEIVPGEVCAIMIPEYVNASEDIMERCVNIRYSYHCNYTV